MLAHKSKILFPGCRRWQERAPDFQSWVHPACAPICTQLIPLSTSHVMGAQWVGTDLTGLAKVLPERSWACVHAHIYTVKPHRDWLVCVFGASKVSPGDPPPLEAFHAPWLGSCGCLHPWNLKVIRRCLLSTESHMILPIFLISISVLPPRKPRNAPQMRSPFIRSEHTFICLLLKRWNMCE